MSIETWCAAHLHTLYLWTDHYSLMNSDQFWKLKETWSGTSCYEQHNTTHNTNKFSKQKNVPGECLKIRTHKPTTLRRDKLGPFFFTTFHILKVVSNWDFSSDLLALGSVDNHQLSTTTFLGRHPTGKVSYPYLQQEQCCHPVLIWHHLIIK